MGGRCMITLTDLYYLLRRSVGDVADVKLDYANIILTSSCCTMYLKYNDKLGVLAGSCVINRDGKAPLIYNASINLCLPNLEESRNWSLQALDPDVVSTTFRESYLAYVNSKHLSTDKNVRYSFRRLLLKLKQLNTA